MDLTTGAAGRLNGMRVLDCTHGIGGAWCSMLLAGLDADVIKIEPPKGEVTRSTSRRCATIRLRGCHLAGPVLPEHSLQRIRAEDAGP